MNQTNPHRSLLRDGHALTVYFLKFADALVIVMAAVLAHVVRFGNPDILAATHYRYAVLASVLLTLVVFSELGVYRTWRTGAQTAMYGRLLFGWSVVLGVLASLSFFSKTGEDYSRLWLGYWALMGLMGVILVRVLARVAIRYAHLKGWGIRRVALVGPVERIRAVHDKIEKTPWTGFRVVLACTESADEAVADGLPCRHLDELAQALTQIEADEVWLAWPINEESRIRDTISSLSDRVLNIRWVPDIFSIRLINHGITELAGMPMLDLSVSPITGLNRVVKELEDKVLALLIVLLLLPVFLILAIGVKLSSPGPILFKQMRHGWDGSKIEVWKFRSMRVHNEEGGRVTQASKHDQRTTRFGRFLRRTSLDELPQFFNVLQGRMSIVGPRPHAIAHNELYKTLIPRYLLRHRVKPGITGWAQVNGLRGETDTVEKMRARVEFDLFYIEHWSVWFDLRIIWRTAATVLFDRHAY